MIAYQGKFPKVHGSVFVAKGARIIGDVEIDEDSSVWFNVVVRGDVHYIRIGKRTNIQDNSVLHVNHDRFPCVIGSDVTIGHQAIVHACTVGDFCLIGMGAIILDNARIGNQCLIAASSLVLENFQVPDGMLVAGVPARIKRPLTPDEKEKIRQSAVNYVDYAKAYKMTIDVQGAA